MNLMLVLLDQNRLQPWFYLYNCFFLVLFFYNWRIDNINNYHSFFVILRLCISAVYVYSGLQKLNPLIEWTEDDVWEYVHEFEVPYNALYDQGYSSIGCAPCTRAIEPGEDVRAGRWWWESAEHKECGLHVKNTEDNHGVTVSS